MATRRDEFYPPDHVLLAFVEQIAIPVLAGVAKDIGVESVASVSVCVCNARHWKFNLVRALIVTDAIDENTEVRLRFRKTYREERMLFSMVTQHADVWRTSGFSGIWLRGNIVATDASVICRQQSMTICYSQGWHEW